MSIVDIIVSIAKYIPGLRKLINYLATNRVCNYTHPRPGAFSLWSHMPKPAPLDEQGPVGEYTTWPMLTDRTFSARHLPPASLDYIRNLPEDTTYNPETGTIGEVTALFAREGNIKKGRSSVLFMFFAQWFTDSILRVNPLDRRKNTSNHNIDLCQIYGLTEATANVLRSKQGGKLTSQLINGEEYPDYLGEVNADGKWQVKAHYKALPYTSDAYLEKVFEGWDEERKRKAYATGLERGNSSVGYVAVSTLFLREHNRICDELATKNPGWDDERLFQTARMINTIILMKLVVQDYINHISGRDLFYFDPSFAEKQDWYRTPWIALEFDMLYRWHGLVPDEITVDNVSYDSSQFLGNNALLEKAGVAAIVDATSKQHAGTISLQNVPTFLLGAEYANIKMGRDFRIASYNDYRRQFGMDALTCFEQLSDNETLRDKLQSMYGHINNVEFIVGLFAERHTKRRLFGDLLNAMVAYDAFTQIYTNPLVSKYVYNKATLTQYGLDLIEQTNSVQDLADRNIKDAKVTANFNLFMPKDVQVAQTATQELAT